MIAVERSFEILRSLSAQADGASVTELSEMLDAPASSVHRLLQVLVDEGFVVQEPASRRYALGPGAFELTSSYSQRLSVASISRPHLAWLTENSGETSFVTSLVGTEPVCVAIAECDRPLRLFIDIGQRMPYHAAASARAILAYQDRDEAERRLRAETFESFTHTTPTNAEDVLAMLDGIRRDGFAICAQELDEHVTAVAAPIRNRAGSVRASATVVGPAERLEGERRDDAIRLVKVAAERISRAWGYVGDDHARGLIDRSEAGRAAADDSVARTGGRG